MQDFTIPSRYQPWLCGVLLLLATVALYGHTLTVPWYFDDHAAIVDNPVVRNLGRAIAEVWRPRGVALLSFALNAHFAGQQVAPYHLTNIAIHFGTALLVCHLLRRIGSGGILWPLLGAALFLVHPLQTQAVTYIVQRMTSLAAFFFLLALALFLHARDAAAAGRTSAQHTSYAASLFCGACAVLCKENTAVLPLALILFVRCFGPGERSWGTLLRSVAPFCVAPALVAAMLLFPALTGPTTLAEVSGYAGNGATPLHYLVTELSVLWVYLRLLILPYGQTLDYGYPLATQLLTPQNLLALAGLLALAWGGWRLRQRWPGVAFALAWFLLTLAVESSIIPLDPLFEHRLYLPLFGFVVAVVSLAQRLPQQRLAIGAMLLILVLCAVLTWQRNALWNEPLAFSADNVRQAPHSDRALFNLAVRTINNGRVEEGLALLRQSLERFPASYRAYAELADYYRRSGRYDDGIAVLQRALQHCTNRATIYNNLGFFYALKGQPQLALANLEQARQADPHFAETYFNTARVLAAHNRLAEAENAYRQGFTEARDDAKAYRDFALFLERQGRWGEAAQAFRDAVRLDPQNSEALAGAQRTSR